MAETLCIKLWQMGASEYKKLFLQQAPSIKLDNLFIKREEIECVSQKNVLSQSLFIVYILGRSLNGKVF